MYNTDHTHGEFYNNKLLVIKFCNTERPQRRERWMSIEEENDPRSDEDERDRG